MCTCTFVYVYSLPTIRYYGLIIVSALWSSDTAEKNYGDFSIQILGIVWMSPLLIRTKLIINLVFVHNYVSMSQIPWFKHNYIPCKLDKHLLKPHYYNYQYYYLFFLSTSSSSSPSKAFLFSSCDPPPTFFSETFLRNPRMPGNITAHAEI